MNCPRCGKTIAEHEAGRCMDAWVAEVVMEWTPWLERCGEYKYVLWQKQGDKEPYRIWGDWEAQIDRYKKITFTEIVYGKHIQLSGFKPSTRIANAWEVVEKFRHCNVDRDMERQELYYCNLATSTHASSSWASSAPLAICRAALMAMEE